MSILPIHVYSSDPLCPRLSRAGIAVLILLLLALFGVPVRMHAQCQPAKPDPAEPISSSKGTPQFHDEPAFTVAGVADANNLGGHGSDTIVRTKETLAKDTASLGHPKSQDSSTASSDDEKALREALKRDSQNAELHHFLGEIEEKRNHPLDAVREYQRAAELNPTEPYLFEWGAELLQHGAPVAAMEVFTKGNRLFPKSPRMLVGLGVALHARGSYDQAAECLCAASDLNPSDPSPYLFLAKMYLAGTVQVPGVVDKLERFSRVHPENALANYYAAAALWKQGKGGNDAALTTHVRSLLEKAISLDPTLGVAYLQLGIVYSGVRDSPRAISSYEQAIAASPALEEAHYRLAQAYRRAGEKDKAQRELQLYEQLSKDAAEKAERERREIQQFVVELRGAKAPPVAPGKQNP